jgi:transcriptional regulator with XRE-family HTH domain
MTTLGQRLRRLRQAAGLSVHQLAKASNTPAQAIYVWEADRSAPTFGGLLQLARALGRSLSEFDSVEPRPDLRRRPKVAAMAD